MVLQYLDIGLSKGFSQNLNGYIHFGNQKKPFRNSCSEIQDFQINEQDFPMQNIKVHSTCIFRNKETLEEP